MYIKNLKLQNFRNFIKKEIKFGKNLTVIYGPNGSGKTNILECINLLATGKSFKARVEEELIAYDSEISRIEAEVAWPVSEIIRDDEKQTDDNHQLSTALGVVLTKGEIEIGEGIRQKTSKKKLLLNGIPKRLVDFSGILKTVIFGPWDMDLVTDSPSIRRKFLDNVLSTVDREYRRSILSYEKGLRQRNRLLWRIREENLSRSQLIFWDQLLIKTGNYICKKRGEFIEYANSTRDFPASEVVKKIYGGKKLDFNLYYDSSVISEGRLYKYKEQELASATTLVGPHRDDFVFQVKSEGRGVKERNLSSFGSRGEQRMGVLWLKMAELKYIEYVSGEVPVLLLDDIYSELDHEHRDIVMEFIGGKIAKESGKVGQVILTTADEHFISGLKEDKMNVINL
jgi:DNA replication and repair protein RecF